MRLLSEIMFSRHYKFRKPKGATSLIIKENIIG